MQGRRMNWARANTGVSWHFTKIRHPCRRHGGINHPPTRGRVVFFRQQIIQRHIHETWITVITFPIRERQFDRFAYGVDVIRGIVAHRLEVKAVQQGHYL